MKRSQPMRRTSMRKPLPERKRSIPTPGTGRGVHTACTDEVVSVPKDAPVRSEPYRRLVASLPCDRCGIVGMSQAAHADFGKGMSLKSSDTTCYPLCGPSADGHPGCHYLIGTHGLLMKERRRKYEADAGARTRVKLQVMSHDDAGVRKVLRDVGLLP